MPDSNFDIRSFATELTAENRTIAGYAIVFNTLSVDMGGFRERIQPNAVTRTMNGNADVWALIGHDLTKVIGRRSAGTLKLTRDAKGVYASIDVAKTSAGDDLLESVRRGDISGMSFRFTGQTKADWTREQGMPIRTVTDMSFSEISPTAMPAYTQTSAAVRDELRSFQQGTGKLPVDLLERIHRQRLLG